MVVESILSGTPVIVSDIPSMQEIFKDFPEFIIGQSDKMLEVIIQKLLHINDLKKVALQARDQFITRFSTDNHLKILHSIYETLDAKTS